MVVSVELPGLFDLIFKNRGEYWPLLAKTLELNDTFMLNLHDLHDNETTEKLSLTIITLQYLVMVCIHVFHLCILHSWKNVSVPIHFFFIVWCL